MGFPNKALIVRGVPSGGGGDGITVFVVAKAASVGAYQSIIRFQGNPGTYWVYPWTGGGSASGRVIDSNDYGTSGPLVGLVAGAWNIGSVVHQRNAVNGVRTYVGGVLVDQGDTADVALPSTNLFIGIYQPGGNEFFTGDLAELIIYPSALSNTDRAATEAYLATKYGL
jgi:hypothetical protein